ncbi:MAG: PLP-dependent aminotransferase family protein, partial [Pseudomonadota bacterium]
MESFLLNPTSTDTLQEQIQRLVIDGILQGRYQTGDRLPSSRGLAEHLGVSRITVTLAYTELVANDYLVSRGRSGYFVSPRAPERRLSVASLPVQESEVAWNSILKSRHGLEMGPARPADWRGYRYNFIYGQTDPKLFDHRHWRLCALKALGQRDFADLAGDSYESDDPRLIERICADILPRRGITANPDQVLITLGAQHALWLSARLLAAPGKTIALETPGYPPLRAILDEMACPYSQVPVDAQGLDPDTLPDGTDLAFTTVSHHCPTNATMPMERRRALLEAASKRDFIIVEDDYEFEIAAGRAPLPALKALDPSGRVIHVGSFSKSLFPSLRLGFLVGPAPFMEAARALRALELRHPPGHIQRTAAYFMELGHYDAQLARMSRAYSRRRAAMAEAIAENALDLAQGTSSGGSSFWMRAPDNVDTKALAQALRERGVLIEPGAVFFGAGDARRQFYRLG